MARTPHGSDEIEMHVNYSKATKSRWQDAKTRKKMLAGAVKATEARRKIRKSDELERRYRIRRARLAATFAPDSDD